MTDKEVTQRAEGAKVAADVGSTGSSFTAYLVKCLPSINKQRLSTVRSKYSSIRRTMFMGVNALDYGVVRTTLTHIRSDDM